MNKLSKKQILLMHTDLLHQTGGCAGIRDEGLLDSALAAPFQEFEGRNCSLLFSQNLLGNL